MSPVEAIPDVMCGMKKLNHHNDFVSGIVFFQSVEGYEL